MGSILLNSTLRISTLIFPPISNFTGANAVGPSTSRNQSIPEDTGGLVHSYI